VQWEDPLGTANTVIYVEVPLEGDILKGFLKKSVAGSQGGIMHIAFQEKLLEVIT
jgi:hypothetical protein